MKNILIVSQPRDTHAYAVTEALQRKGANVCFWHTSDFPTISPESVLFGPDGPKVLVPALQSGDSSPVFDTVWLRRPACVLDRDGLHPADIRFAETECNIFRRSLFNILAPGAFWVNPPEEGARTSRKLFQFRVAVSVGLKTPATLFSNDPQQIRDFIRTNGGRIIYKPFAGAVWRSEETSWVPFTSGLSEEELIEDRLLMATPGIYQELVPKAYELRVTIMGRQVFATKLLSQETEDGKLDWRKDQDGLRLEPYQLPIRISQLCVRLMKRLGIVFGCFDFVVTPAGDYIFLEVNEMGQFLFIEGSTGAMLLDSFSEFLLHGSPTFTWTKGESPVAYQDVQEAVSRHIESALQHHVPVPDSAIWEGS